MQPQSAAIPAYAVNGRTYRCPFADVLRPLTPDEDRALAADIATRGVITPVVVTDADEVLDGANRLRIALTTGLAEVPVRVVAGLTDAQKRAMAIDLNVHRRHLTRAEQKKLVASELRTDPARSNAAVAAVTGLTDKTVAVVRRNLEATSEIPELEATVGRDGRRRAAKRRRAESAAVEATLAGTEGTVTAIESTGTPATPAVPPTPQSSCQPRLFDPAGGPEPTPAPPPTQDGPKKKSTWKSDLNHFWYLCDKFAREFKSLSRVQVSKRSPVEVRQVAVRLRAMVDDLDRRVADLTPA